MCKGNDSVHKACAKASENNRKMIYECEKECNEIDQSFEGMIGVFVQKKIIIKETNCNFI